MALTNRVLLFGSGNASSVRYREMSCEFGHGYWQRRLLILSLSILGLQREPLEASFFQFDLNQRGHGPRLARFPVKEAKRIIVHVSNPRGRQRPSGTSIGSPTTYCLERSNFGEASCPKSSGDKSLVTNQKHQLRAEK